MAQTVFVEFQFGLDRLHDAIQILSNSLACIEATKKNKNELNSCCNKQFPNLITHHMTNERFYFVLFQFYLPSNRIS